MRLALVLVRPNGHVLSPELGSSFGGGVGGGGGTAGGVIRTGLYPRSTAASALHYAHSTPRVNAGDLTSQPSLQAGGNIHLIVHSGYYTVVPYLYRLKMTQKIRTGYGRRLRFMYES